MFKFKFKKKFFQNKFSGHNLRYLSVIVVAVFFFAFGYLFSRVSNLQNGNLFSASAAEVSSGVNFNQVFSEVKSYINDYFIPWKDNYVPPTDADLDYGMIKGYVDAYGDPHTQFFTPEEAKQFEENVQGSFGGIGAVVGYVNNTPTILSVLKGNPAEAIGLKAGDQIVSVDGQSVTGMTVDQTVSLIRGEIGTSVNLGVIHQGQSEVSKYNVVRAQVKIPIIDTETKDGVFIIHFSSFTETSGPEFEKALQQFINSGDKYLMIDLRGNGGGYLDSAVNIASLFLPKEDKVVIEKNSKVGNDTIDYSKGLDYLKNDANVKIGVLVDGGTASAAEILTGALKDNGVATVIGEKTYGKGSVQRLFPLSDGSAVKITIEKWYTPNGVSISLNGITPDTIASSTPASVDANGNLVDPQLDAAIQDLKSN